MNGKDLWDRPVVRHRLQVGGYARIHGNTSQTAKRFNHDRKTTRDYRSAELTAKPAPL